MDEFWLSETDFLVPARLEIERRNRWLGAQTTGQPWDDEEHQTVSHVRWRQSNEIHEISYQEYMPSGPAEEGSNPDSMDGQTDDGAGRVRAGKKQPEVTGHTVCRLEPGTLTWQRNGEVEWKHVFQAGDTRSSFMTVPGAGTIEVKLKTRDVEVTVAPTGGLIRVAYDMTISDVQQYVELSMRFTRT
jgi:Domain of unknown function (DUF1934)